MNLLFNRFASCRECIHWIILHGWSASGTFDGLVQNFSTIKPFGIKVAVNEFNQKAAAKLE